MIKHLVVTGLHGKFDFDLVFNGDLNLLTGRNGSGKTTLLKLLWYLISGNLERITPEMTFDTVEIETSDFDLKMALDRNGQICLDWKMGEKAGAYQLPIENFESGRSHKVNELNRQISIASKSSIFFPTFRRIEAGYRVLQKIPDQQSPFQDIMADLSSSVSDDNHRFVASVSTHDIIELLTQAYADTFEPTNLLNKNLATFIKKRIQDYSIGQDKTEPKNLKHAASILEDIQGGIARASKEREYLLRPFTVLSESVGKIFQYNGIRITESITLGEAQEAISSEELSSGEKQMLSFLCYNAFMKNSSIFIDEPELSLHVDWQRLLFPVLLSQRTGNQLIVATHSPMIYSTYSDKELILDGDRGGD